MASYAVTGVLPLSIDGIAFGEKCRLAQKRKVE